MGKVRPVGRRRHVQRARDLRPGTSAEGRLWERLRDRRLGGWKWRRQAPCGPFIADFLCHDAALIVELDGDAHLGRELYDQRRSDVLRRLGFRVVRFPNAAVIDDPEGVCRTILEWCTADAASRSAGRTGA